MMFPAEMLQIPVLFSLRTVTIFFVWFGGYYYSSDLIEWKLIDDTNLPTESFAPTVVEMQGELYYTASYATDTIYKTDNPKSGVWEAVACNFPPGMLEPMLFMMKEDYTCTRERVILFL